MARSKVQLDLFRPARRRVRRRRPSPSLSPPQTKNLGSGSVAVGGVENRPRFSKGFLPGTIHSGPSRGGKRQAPHKTRPAFSPRHPLHVTYTVLQGIGYLRRRDMYRAIERSLRRCCARPGFRICHFSVQGNHLHFIIEADDKRALSTGMQGFGISCAKQINKTLGNRSGQVFAERYGCKVIAHPKQVRSTLSYVLNNWRKHGTGDVPRYVDKDGYSSADYFDGWTYKSRRQKAPVPLGSVSVRLRWRPDDPDDDPRPLVAAPRTLLLATGWQRYGLISPREEPSS